MGVTRTTEKPPQLSSGEGSPGFSAGEGKGNEGGIVSTRKRDNHYQKYEG